MTGEAKKAGESADGKNALRWIRFERYLRYHAIYTHQRGLYWTYCGMCVRLAAVGDEKKEPPACCACCRSRLKRPYLIPEKIARLKRDQTP